MIHKKNQGAGDAKAHHSCENLELHELLIANHNRLLQDRFLHQEKKNLT